MYNDYENQREHLDKIVKQQEISNKGSIQLIQT